MKTKTYGMACAILIALVGQTVNPPTAAADASNPVVQVQTYGSTYGELSARWWQWVLSLPTSINPNLDEDGRNCAQGQYDDVWFLAGAFGGPYTRSCTIPAGKPIFFPVVNTIAFNPTANDTLLTLRGSAADFIDTVEYLKCTIDGIEVSNLSSFRVRSPSFTVIAPSRGVVPPGKLAAPGKGDPIVSDGYWLLVEPLSAGEHVIRFEANNGEGGFALDVTYHLTVAGP
jgi:hypothetical protein